MLLILPFHLTIYKIIKSWSNELSVVFNRLDELTILILFPPAIIKLYRDRDITFRLSLILLFPIFLISASGFVSGMLNNNLLLVTILGTADYVKQFLVIFIFAAFIRDFNEFKKIFRFLLIVAVFIGLVAFVQEIWAIYLKYVLGNDFYYTGSRFGIYRAPSLLSHYNLLGLYSIFILTFYLFMSKKINLLIMFSLLSGIFMSVSRMAYMGFVFLAGLQIFKGRRWLAVFLIPVVAGLIFMSTLDDYNVLELIEQENIKQNTETGPVYYREFARFKAMNVWKDHPVWGVGPGMFGGPTAYKNRSSVYEEYNFHIILRTIHSLDQFWPQALAELGIVGTAAFAALIISLLVVFFISRQQVTSAEKKGLFNGLGAFTIIYFVFYSLSGNLNINFMVLFTYCGFAGMGMGIVRSCNDK